MMMMMMIDSYLVWSFLFFPCVEKKLSPLPSLGVVAKMRTTLRVKSCSMSWRWLPWLMSFCRGEASSTTLHYCDIMLGVEEQLFLLLMWPLQHNVDIFCFCQTEHRLLFLAQIHFALRVKLSLCWASIMKKRNSSHRADVSHSCSSV